MSEAQSILEAVQGHFQRGDGDSAKAAIRRLAEIPPEDPMAVLRGAFAAFQLGDPSLAERIIHRVIEAHPGLAAAQQSLAKLLHGTGRTEEAETWIARAAKLAPGEAAIHETFGIVLDAKGRPDRAEEAFRRAVALAPGNPQYLDCLGQALQKQAKDSEAIEVFREVLKREPNRAPTHFNIGVLLLKRELNVQAEKMFREALRLDPAMVPARNNLALALQRSGRLEEAASEFRKVARDAPQRAEPCFNLASLLLAQGDAKGAISACDQALAREPSNNTAISLKAIALCEAGDFEAARYYNDVDRFLIRGLLEGAGDSAELKAFNDALFEQVDALPDRLTEPGTEHARQTLDFFAEPTGPVAAFHDLIEAAVAAYADALEPADHPFVAARPAAWRLFGWGTIVREVAPGENTHMHPPAWVSGVYYPRIPDEVDEFDPEHGGWIEFGRPPNEIRHSYDPPVTLIHPREGLLVLFPAYFHHRIVPFRTRGTRMSLAFDVMPLKTPGN